MAVNKLVNHGVLLYAICQNKASKKKPQGCGHVMHIVSRREKAVKFRCPQCRHEIKLEVTP